MGNKQCSFCEIIQENDPNKIIYQDDQIVMFNDINPCGRIHIQIIPKHHIKNINELTREHLKMLIHMKESGAKYLAENYPDVNENEMKFGFHIPPFIGVDHLHLHCLVPPFTGKYAKIFKFGWIYRDISTQINKIKSSNK